MALLSKPKVKGRKREEKQEPTESTLNWSEFLSSAVTKFREYFENELTLDEQELFRNNPEGLRGASFSKPCQIAVFDFVKPFPIAYFVTHNPDHSDLEFHIYAKIKNPKELENRIVQEKPFWLKDIMLHGFFKEVKKDVSWTSSWSSNEDSALLLFAEDEARVNPEYVARGLFGSMQRDLIKRVQRDQIGKTTIDLKQDALEISEPQVRAKVLEASAKIEEALRQMKRLDKYEKKLGSIEKEIGGVRRLIGVTKEYQDFKVLTSVVDEMKKDHVRKALFDETIKRVDEKINGLSTRIDDMKTIKFWSKRTVVEVTLAAIAVASALITALFSAGVLHF